MFGRITARDSKPKGLHANSDIYGFYVRLPAPEQELLKRVVERARERLGGVPSNPVLLKELMQSYVEQSA